MAKEIFVAICAFFRSLKRGRDPLFLDNGSNKEDENLCEPVGTNQMEKISFMLCKDIINGGLS